MSASPRVLLIDDDPQRIEQVTSCLGTLTSVTLVKPCIAPVDVDQKIKEINEVDVILIDLRQAAFLRSLAIHIPLAQWIVFTTSADTAIAISQAICDGANGELRWDADCEVFESTITQVHYRHPWFSSDVARHLSELATKYNISLTPTQRTVLTALAGQRSLAEIVTLIQPHPPAAATATDRTVYSHLDSILRALHQVAGGQRA